MKDQAREAAIDAAREARLAPFNARAAELTKAINDILPGHAEQAGPRLSVVRGQARADISQSTLPIATNDDIRIDLQSGDNADVVSTLITSIVNAVEASRAEPAIGKSDLVWSLPPEQGYHWQVQTRRDAVKELTSLGYVKQNETSDKTVFGWKADSAT